MYGPLRYKNFVITLIIAYNLFPKLCLAIIQRREELSHHKKQRPSQKPPQPKSLLRSRRHNHDAMAGPTTRARASWAVDRATSLSEVWAIVAKHLGLVGAWRLMLVCRAAPAGAKEWPRFRGSSCAGGARGVVGS